MTKPEAVKAKIRNNNRVFMLMIGCGNAKVFRYLNREFDKLIKVTRFLEGK